MESNHNRLSSKPDKKWFKIEDENYRKYEEEIGRKVKKATEVTKESVERSQDPLFRLLYRHLLSEKLPEAINTSETNNDSGSKESSGSKEKLMTEKLRELIWDNFVKTGREFQTNEDIIYENEILLDITRKEKGNEPNETTKTYLDNIDRAKARIGEPIRKTPELAPIKELANESPEAHTFIYGTKLRKYQEQVRSGELVTTPYVQEHLNKVVDSIKKGKPVYMRGHKGGGKTELAIQAAVTASIKEAAQKDAYVKCLEFGEANLEATPEELSQHLGKMYKKCIKEYTEAYRKGEKNAHKMFDPYFISGSSDISSKDFFAKDTLVLSKSESSIEEKQKELDNYIEYWKKDHPEEAKDPATLEYVKNALLQIYISDNQAFGTTVETIPQQLTKAIIEGKPIIIDEGNTISPGVLQSLHTVLTKSPNSQGPKDNNIRIPGFDIPLTIRPGFCIIMTGNQSSEFYEYIGTQDLNGATEDRFLTDFEYDYLPMGNIKGDKHNELYQVVIAKLLDRNGNLRLPDIEHSMSDLFKLCQLTHDVQLIFERKWAESEVIKDNHGNEQTVELQETVLSIRGLLNILEDWNKGEKKSLEESIWDMFIGKIKNSNDQSLILQLAKNKYGFFDENDGWNLNNVNWGVLATKKDVHPGLFERPSSPMETYSLRKVVEEVFGKDRPKREIYPDINFSDIEILSEGDDRFTDSDEDLKEIEEIEEDLNNKMTQIEALWALYKKCGCETA